MIIGTLAGSTNRRVQIVTLAALALLALAIVGFLAARAGRALYWGDDHAIFLIDIFHASAWDQQLGIASRFGWAHPGPLNYYLLLPWYYLAQGGEQGLLAGTAALNAICLGLAVWLMQKMAGRALATAFAVMLVGYLGIALGPMAFFDVLIPFSSLFPWAAALCLALAVALRGLAYTVALAVLSAFLTQLHVAFWLPTAVLWCAAVGLALVRRRPSRGELACLLASVLILVLAWLPPLLEFDNLRAIFRFFLSGKGGQHDWREAFHAYAVLIGQPLLGQQLNLADFPAQLWPFHAGAALLVALPLTTWYAFRKKREFAAIAGLLLLLQVAVSLYALTRVSGPILHHSITFFPVIAVFIVVQMLAALMTDSERHAVPLGAASLAGLALLFFAGHASLQAALRGATAPNTVIQGLHQQLSSEIDRCAGPATVVIEQPVWSDSIGAVAAAYRAGKPFAINPPDWALVFGGRVAVEPTACQIRFLAQTGKTAIRREPGPATAPVTLVPVLRLADLHFSPFGTARFDLAHIGVASDGFTDAGLVSNQIVLPEGEYRLDAVLDMDVSAEHAGSNAGHISIHGQKLLVRLLKPRAANKAVSASFHSDGKPFALSFGLGGWSSGKGRVRLTALQISSVRPIQ